MFHPLQTCAEFRKHTKHYAETMGLPLFWLERPCPELVNFMKMDDAIAAIDTMVTHPAAHNASNCLFLELRPSKYNDNDTMVYWAWLPARKLCVCKF